MTALLPLVVDAPARAPWEAADPDASFDAFHSTVLALASTVGPAPLRRVGAPALLLQVLARLRIRCSLFGDGVLHARVLPSPTWAEPSWRDDHARVYGVLTAFLPDLLLRAGEAAGVPCAGGCGTMVPIQGLFCPTCYAAD